MPAFWGTAYSPLLFKENSMNSDVIVSYQGGTLRNQIASQTLASTTETAFVANTDTGSGTTAILTIPPGTSIVGSTSPQDPTASPAALMGGLGRQYGAVAGSSRPYYSALSFDNGRPFIVTITGLATPASNSGNTLAINLYWGTSISGTKIATTAAVPQATTTSAQNFILQAQLGWDSTSQCINGQYWFSLPGTSGTTYTTWAATTQATGVTLATLQFCASAKWGNAVGGVVAVSEFTIARG
jgi:hypothetical protein